MRMGESAWLERATSPISSSVKLLILQDAFEVQTFHSASSRRPQSTSQK